MINISARIKNMMSLGKTVIIDMDNRDIESRRKLCLLAKLFDAKKICFWFNHDLNLLLHLNEFKSITENKRSYNKNTMKELYDEFNPPSVKEGFDCIVNVQFNARFESKIKENIFRMHLV